MDCKSIYIGSNPILPSIYTFLEMILHKTILNLCDSETSKKIIFNINEDRIEVPKLDNRGINDRIRKEGYILFDAKTR